MHELGLAQELVDRCRAEARGRQVLEVWANCPVGLDMPELSECFSLLALQLEASGEDWLGHAELKLQARPVSLACRCGFEGVLDRDHVAGHMTICPQCAEVSETGGDVELTAILYRDIQPLDFG